MASVALFLTPPFLDSKLLPVQVEQIMMEVQNNANYMPAWQTEVSYLPHSFNVFLLSY